MPLEKSFLTANGQAMPMKGTNVIKSVFDIKYTVIQHIVYVFDSPEARMNILGMTFLAKNVEFDNLRNPMLILTVFAGKCVLLSLYLDKVFPNFSQVNSVELPQDLAIAPYSTRVLTLIAQDEKKYLFRKGTRFLSHKMLSTMEFILVCTLFTW